jgi:glycosyltransferase involved in cell wall biosynthesis
VPIKEYGFGGALDLSTAKQVRALAKDFKPHAITSWMNRATRFVPKGPWATMGRLGGYYDLKYYTGKVDWLAGNTQDICDYCVKNGWDAGHVLYLPNFVPEPAETFRQKRADVRRQLNFAVGDVVLLQAGRLHPNKAVDISLKALAKLPKRFKLILAGEGPQREELEEYAKTLDVADRIVWMGWVSDLSGLAAAADIWLAPSRFEPLGNIVLDAWMHSVPVIAAKSVGPSHLITHGENGLLFEIDDAEELKANIVKVADDPQLAVALADAGLATGRTRFGEERVVAQYIEAYQKMMQDKGVSHE